MAIASSIEMINTVLDVLQGNITGEPLISIWRHYPQADLDPERLTRAHVADYKRYPSDLLKLSPHGRFCVADFGCEVEPGTTTPGQSGSSHCKQPRINTPPQWEEIEYVDPNDGHLGMQLDYIARMKEELPDVPMMMTLFAPTMIGQMLSDKQLLSHMHDDEYKNQVEDAIGTISDVMTEFTSACVDAGVDGFFAAMQELDRSIYTELQIEEMISLNISFMNHVNKTGQFTVLHLHGDHVAFEKGLRAFQPTAVNWHDKTSGPSLQQASGMFDGGLLGGLEPSDVLNRSHVPAIEHAKTLREELPLILAPGCVLLQGTPDKAIDDIFQLYR